MKIVAIGGYKSENEKKQEFITPLVIDERIVSLSGKKSPKVLFLSTASSDSDNYEKAFRKIYELKLKCEVDLLKLSKEKPPKKEIEKKISCADVIYVGGGNTLKMMKTWRRLGLDRLLKSALQQGTVLCGVSAGSICWFEYGISDSLQFCKPGSHQFIRVRGLGFLPFINNPHHGSALYDKGYRTVGMKKITKRSKGVCLAIPDGCAMEFNGKTYKVLSGMKGAKASKAYWLNGKYHLDEIPSEGMLGELMSVT